MEKQKVIQYFTDKLDDYEPGEFGFQYEEHNYFITLFGFIDRKRRLSGVQLAVYECGVEITRESDCELVYEIIEKLK